MELFGIRRRIRNFFQDAREADQLRVQLAGVSVAALGGTDPKHTAKRGQWGWSVAYQDTLDLRIRHDHYEQRLQDWSALRGMCECRDKAACYHARCADILGAMGRPLG